MPQFHHWSDFTNYWKLLQSQASRGLLVLEECSVTYQQVLPKLLACSQLTGVSVNLPGYDLGVSNIKPQQASQYLGRSHNLLIYRACDEFNVNSFCALCGTLVGASLAILIVPAGQPWQHHIDAQGVDYGYLPDNVQSPFKHWWQAVWQNHKGVMQLSQQAQQEVTLASVVALAPLPAITPSLDLSSISLLPDQQQLVVKLVASATAAQKSEQRVSAKQLIWVCGARGRGKTVAVAKALEQLATKGVNTLITSAASQTAKAVLHQHGEQTDYIAVDQLVQQITAEQAALNNTVLVIEEAASLPHALLQALMQGFSCLVLVSSSDGYEGTGQGLSLKLPQLAQRHEFQLTTIELTEPIRWQEGDLLEELVQQSFLAPKLPVLVTNTHLADLEHHIYTGAQLALDEPILAQVYGLLSLAHYQTTPQDLRLLLDHPDLSTHCWLNQQGNLIGVACLIAEGGLSQDLSVAIARGQRRIKGHLLAQILAQQAGCAEAAQLPMRRIQRIAVHPAVQGQGIGRFMLQQIHRHYQASSNSQWLGSSFAGEPDVIRFWQAAGYQVIWAGQRLDAATGLPSVQLVLPLQNHGLRLSKLLLANFYHYYAHLNWDSPLTKSILTLLEPTYRGLPSQLLPHLFDQVGNYHGNVYGVQGYLYRALLHKEQLSHDEKQWLTHNWQPRFSQKQFSQLTRQLVAQQLPIDSGFLVTISATRCSKRKG